MLTNGVHFDFFFHQKKRNYKLGDYKKLYRQSQLRSGEIEKQKTHESLGTYPPWAIKC